MIDNAWIVVKVGGSLFDLPDLRSRLHRWLTKLGDVNVIIVPGGGAMADAIRALDRTHQLGEEEAHWLAIEALSINARFLKDLLPEARLDYVIPDETKCQWCLLDPSRFFLIDDVTRDHLPHRWQVTSDSLAVRVATIVEARRLVLLKSVDWHGDDWAEASKAGVVDGYFAEALRQAPSLRVRVVNFRTVASPAAAP